MKKIFQFTNWLCMSRRLLLMIVAFNLQSSFFNLHAQTIGEVFYIYRNDGQFNAFFRDEVDSIAYSHFDTDSIFYDEIVTQLVYTPDSLYRIPLASIDSIGFVQPETKYKENTVPLTGELFDYLIQADSLTLTFASYTPSALIPKIGDKLVATDLTDKLPIGFTGIVQQVQEGAGGYEVICDSLDLEEVVDRLYAVIEIVGSQTDGNVRRFLPRRAKSEQIQSFRLVLPSISQKLNLTPLLRPKDMYSLNGKAVAQTTANPVITGKITYVKDKLLKLDQYNIHIILDVPTITKMEAVGQATNSNDSLSLSSNKTSLAIQGTRIGPYGIPFYYAFGPKFDLSGELALGTTVYADFAQTVDITFYPATITLGAAIPGINMINTVDVSGPRLTHFDVDWAYIAGRISARCAVVGRLGIGIAAKGNNLGWFGAELKLGAKAEAELGFDFEAMSNAEKGTGFYDGLKSKSKVVVMPFCGLEGKVSVVDDRFQFTFIGSGDIPLPGKLQWDFLPIFSDTKAVSNGTSTTVSANITNDCIIPYTVGFSLFDENNNRIGEPQWNEQKYWTRNSFALPLKATFTDLATDKKYKVYPSLKLFGFTVLASPCAELNMHFPVTFTDCPDSNHPHMIDLGLPSGTKWACCNVGAFWPDSHGDVYSWGETRPKSSIYDFEENYAYWHSDGDNAIEPDDFVYIGSDIAGTSYDAATVNWGAPWRMPTKAQIRELRTNCNYVWTDEIVVNGYKYTCKGVKFTGPNGGTIFFPADYRDWGNIYHGTYGCYWSSSLREEFQSQAWILYFDQEGHWFGDCFMRYRACFVRPVR